MRKTINLVGKKFHRLTVIGFDRHDRGKSYWQCECECGTRKVVRADKLQTKRGPTESCGCLNKERSAVRLRKVSTTHGMTAGKASSKEWPRIYRIWGSMKGRCKPYAINADRYYERGITVCPEWQQSFEKFQEDMGPTYFPGAEIDRIDNDKGYSNDNCRWVTSKENQNNKTDNRLITHNGETLSVAQWAERLGLKASTVAMRLWRGDPIEKVLTPGLLKSPKS